MAAIMDYEVADWERLFWFLRFLIPELKVKSKNDDELKDLLNSIDLNTYGARRTALNQHIELDSGESTIDPLAPKMVNGGDDGEKDPLDEIVKQFNDHWFKGWDAMPDEQKAKIINLSKMVREDEDYQYVEGNPDQQASDQVLAKIIKKQMIAMRRGDKSLYKQYKDSDAFQYGMLQAVKGFIANRDHIRV